MAQEFALELNDLAEELYGAGMQALEDSLNNEPLSPEMSNVIQQAHTLVTELQNYITRINVAVKQSSINNTLSNIQTNFHNEYFDLKKEIRNINLLQQQREYQQLEQLETMIYQHIFQFQTALNTALGQKVHMVMVYTDKNTGEVTIFEHNDNLTMEDLTFNMTRGNLSINWEAAQEKYKKLQNIDQQLTELQQGSLEGIESTYAEVRRRADISRRKIHAKSGRILILWKETGDWDGNWVGGYGDLAEAYASFYLNAYTNNRVYIFSNFIESAVREFMRDEVSGAENVDSTSGLLQGDFTIGNQEYAVKSQIGRGNDYNRASPMQWKQVVTFAEWIVQHPNLLSKEFLLKLKERFQERCKANAHSGRLTELLNNTANKSFKEIMDILDAAGWIKS